MCGVCGEQVWCGVANRGGVCGVANRGGVCSVVCGALYYLYSVPSRGSVV